MKSISVHGIDTEIERKIGERAKSEGKSVNRIVKELMAKALGMGDQPPDNRALFEDLSGVWSEEEASEFAAAIADLETTEDKDWK